MMNCIYVDRERAEGTGTSGAAAKVQQRLLRAAAAHAGHEEEDHERPVLLFPGALASPQPTALFLLRRGSAAKERGKRALSLSPPPCRAAEGTTTNGTYLLPFRTGAFIAGVPVQPVLLLYKWDRFSPAWESIAAGRHIFFLLSHLYQTLEVVFLPVYAPSEEEKKDPALYAANVRRIMAEAGKFELTHHTLAHKRVYQGILSGQMDVSAAEGADVPGALKGAAGAGTPSNNGGSSVTTAGRAGGGESSARKRKEEGGSAAGHQHSQ